MTERAIKGVLFDLDGVLIDTEGIYDMRFNFLALASLAVVMNLGAALTYRKRS